MPGRRPDRDAATLASPSAGSPYLSLADFNAIVGAVYECVLDPSGWSGVVGRMRDAVGATGAWIAVHYPDHVRSVYEIEVGTDPEWQRRLRDTYVPMSPFISVRHHAKVGDILAVDDVVDYREFAEGRFFKEWAGPQGWPDFIMAVLTVESHRFSWLGFCLPERANAEQKALTAAFRPHVERALRISDLLELRTAQAADLTTALEGLATGVMLVDATLAVSGINPAAEALVRETGTLRVVGDRLRCPHDGQGAELAAAVAACGDAAPDRAGASILFSDSAGGLGLLVHVLPLTRARVTRPDAPVAAIFLSRPGAATEAPLKAFVKRFDLTPSETRVLLAIMEGKTPRAIAAAQGVRMPTVRTHLHRLFAKTATTGQPDLVRLVASVSKLA